MKPTDTSRAKPATANTPKIIESASTNSKIKSSHCERQAIVYVRQSTPHQVQNHRESLDRQYALADHAVALGWPNARVSVIDDDLGISGRSAEGRVGFQHLLAEVTMGHVGIVLGLEMSRLARSSKDWHNFFEMCAIFGTLIADEDGVYDGNDPNDRLLLGLKGIISEMELHVMRNRLERGKLNKAQRGKLFLHAPVGYVKSPNGDLILDPDEQVRATIRLLFDKFDELGSAHAVFKYLSQSQIRLGIRPIQGPNKGKVECRPVKLSTVYAILRNPTYAGTYTYGRCPVDHRRLGAGKSSHYRCAPMEEWKVIRHNEFPPFITWDQYLQNRRKLQENRTREDTRGCPRHGSALLTGLVFCGRCGSRMVVGYRYPDRPRYDCAKHIRRGERRTCRGLSARPLMLSSRNKS